MHRYAPATVLILVLLVLWEAYCRATGVTPLVLPAPSGVIGSLVENAAEIGGHAAATAAIAGMGFAVSVAFAFLTSVALHFAPLLERALVPVFVTSQTIPLVALAPLVILWFGFGVLPKVLLVVLVTFFPILLSLLSGYRQAPRDFLDLVASMGAGRLEQFRRVTLPAARPSFFAGVHISATYAIVAAIFAEYAGARSGIGIYILQAKNNFRADLILAAVTMSAALTLALLGLLRLAERLTDPERKGRRHAAG